MSRSSFLGPRTWVLVLPVRFGYKFVSESGGCTGRVKANISDKLETEYFTGYVLKGIETMKKYECAVCGYIYDPEDGDSDGGIPAGTAFEKLPEDWVCPICGAAKSEFHPVD